MFLSFGCFAKPEQSAHSGQSHSDAQRSARTRSRAGAGVLELRGLRIQTRGRYSASGFRCFASAIWRCPSQRLSAHHPAASGAATHHGGFVYCEQLISVDRCRWVCLDDQIGYDLRTNGTGAGAMLFVPAAVGSDRAGRQATHVVGIVGNEPVNHATARPCPLLAPALHASVGKAKSLLRCPPLVSQLHEELVHLHPLGQEPDRAILLDDTQQDGIFLAPRTGAERRARIRGL